MTVAIVADSGSDLTPAQLLETGIRQVPLSVTFGEQTYLSPDDLSPQAFWERLLAPDSPFPHTAAPSIGLFKQAFEKAFEDGHDEIVWVGGHVIGHDARVTERTQTVVILKLTRLGEA